MSFLKENIALLLSILFGAIVFYVATVSSQSAANAVKRHEDKAMGVHPPIEQKLADNKASVSVIKNDIEHIKDEVDRIQRAQEAQTALLNDINSKL